MEYFYKTFWIRGPDCQCSTCQTWKSEFILPLRVHARSLAFGEPKLTRNELETLKQQVDNVYAPLLPKKKWWKPKAWRWLEITHWNAQVHFLGWLNTELREHIKEAEQNG